jgi:hypothetical protein
MLFILPPNPMMPSFIRVLIRGWSGVHQVVKDYESYAARALQTRTNTIYAHALMDMWM